MLTAEPLDDLPGLRHGFFTREGGVSEGAFESLNCGFGSRDEPGRVAVNRIPYPVDQALELLAPYRRIVLVGARPPVAFFAYPDKPGVLTAEGASFVELADIGADITAALNALSIVSTPGLSG